MPSVVSAAGRVMWDEWMDVRMTSGLAIIFDAGVLCIRAGRRENIVRVIQAAAGRGRAELLIVVRNTAHLLSTAPCEAAALHRLCARDAE